MGALPSVYILETKIPDKIIDDVNDYMDEYKEDTNKKSHSDNLVGQTNNVEQLLLEHNEPRMVDFFNFDRQNPEIFFAAFGGEKLFEL